jgi:nicotinamidase-related amidase
MVVDIQERLMPMIAEQDQVVKNSVLLLKAAKVMRMPILATTQYAARIGDFLPEIKAELSGITAIDKMEFGGFNNPAVKIAAEHLPPEIDTLILCGVETHICIYQTAIGALLEGYKVWVPADAVSSRVHHNHRTGISRIREIGGEVANTELIIYELLHKAGTQEFKELLPFLK